MSKPRHVPLCTPADLNRASETRIWLQHEGAGSEESHYSITSHDKKPGACRHGDRVHEACQACSVNGMVSDGSNSQCIVCRGEGRVFQECEKCKHGEESSAKAGEEEVKDEEGKAREDEQPDPDAGVSGRTSGGGEGSGGKDGKRGHGRYDSGFAKS